MMGMPQTIMAPWQTLSVLGLALKQGLAASQASSQQP